MSDLLNLDDLNNTDWNEIASTADQSKKSGGIFTKDDERIWKPDYTKAQIYQFYFLPDLKSKSTIFGFETHTVKYFEDNKEKKLFGVCPKSVGKDCPICSYGWDRYNDPKSGEIDKKESKNFLPQKQEYCNILMVKDPMNPENNGKVFLYKLPVSVRKLINERLKPSDKNLQDDEFVEFIPFQWNKTSKFKLDVSIESTNRSRCNYDKSKFIARNEKELETIASSKEEALNILNSCYNLKETITEYTNNKYIKEDKYSPDTMIGKMLKGGYSGITVSEDSYRPSTNNSAPVVDESNDGDGVTDDEAEFINSFK